MTRTDVDVVVVGGGPVGLAAAIEARSADWSVVVLEPRPTPVDKACGEGLMPGAVRAFERLGVRPEGHPLAGIRYVGGDRAADHPFATRHGLGVRRTRLHAALAARAEELEIPVLPTRVTEVHQDPDGVTVAGLRARWLLACDGLHSTVRRLAGLERPDRHPAAQNGQDRRRFGIRRHVRTAPWTDFVEVHWGRHAEAYVTPVAPDLVGIALLGPRHTDFETTLAELPALAQHLDGSPVEGATLGAGPLHQRSIRRTEGRIRLVGDASGYVDALTGEGLRVGLAQARAAVATLEVGNDSVAAGNAAYERAWAEATHDYRVLTSWLVRAAGSPLRRGIVPLAAAWPGLYGGVVERLAR